MNTSSVKVPLHKAIGMILLSVLIVSGSGLFGVLYYRYLKKQEYENSKFDVVAIIQSTKGSEKLKTVYLAEILQLSVDCPTNLSRFNSNQAQDQLLKSPLIKEAFVYKYFPDTIYIDYEMRRPIAILGDYKNAAIDIDGVIFPFKPFFSPKKLPTIYLGLGKDSGKENDFSWGDRLTGKALDLGLDLLHLLPLLSQEGSVVVQRIDLSQGFASSYGQRQIVIILEDYETKMVQGHPVLFISPYILRLSSDHYQTQVKQYVMLKKHLKNHSSFMKLREKSDSEKSKSAAHSQFVHKNQPIVIDMRIKDLAFIVD